MVETLIDEYANESYLAHYRPLLGVLSYLHDYINMSTGYVRNLMVSVPCYWRHGMVYGLWIGSFNFAT